jgi:AraC family transcriptional regulator, positive regulator of tynA and feaB
MEQERKAFEWDWCPRTWSWSPDKERLSPAHGLPREAVGLQVSTEGIAPRESYDFWRETVFYAFEADRRDREQASPFAARASGVISADAGFYAYRSDAVSGQRSRQAIDADGCDDIDIGLVLEGWRAHEHENGEEAATRPDEFFVYDAAVPSRVAWQAHRGLHLSLRRRAVEAASGRDFPEPAAVARALAGSPMGPVLKSQFALLSHHLHEVDRRDRAFLLDQTAELALHAIGRLGFGASRGARERAALFTAAQRLIEKRFADPEFGTEALAHLLGCSRATLYRVFADNDMTVADAIRTVRLMEARRLLETMGERVPIGAIGQRCGLPDRANFNRVFRRQFGLSPSEARERARSGS